MQRGPHMSDTRLPKLSDCLVFFDFDNTITMSDVVDDIIAKFSINQEWVALENSWKRGEIGSRICLAKQFESVRVTKSELVRYLSLVRIDPHFESFLAMLKREGIKPVILSDNFTFVIETILHNNGIDGVKVYANELKFSGDRLIASFPYSDKNCGKCAHCKKKSLLGKNVRDNVIIYIGDGMSDVCPCRHADIVFAKDDLLDYFRKDKRLCLAFNNIEDIKNYFRGLQ